MKYVLNIVLAFLIDTWRAFVAVMLYNWFILTKFTGLPAISVLNMLGIIFFAAMFSPSRPSEDEEDNARLPEVFVGSALKSLILLGIGFLVHLFV